MATISELVVSMELQSAQFQAQMTKVNSQLGSLDRRAKQASSGMANFAASLKRVVGPLAAVFAAQRIISGIGRLIDGMDAIAKTAPKIGLTTKALQELQYAAGLSGVEAKGLQTAMQRLSVNMLDAGRGVKEMEEAFKNLGVAGEKDATKVLDAVADRFAKMPDGAIKTAEATKLFGRAGADLIPLLNQGSAGLRKYADEANRLGLIIGDKALKASEKFNDSMSTIGKMLSILVVDAIGPFITWVGRVATAFINARKEGRGFLGTLKDIAVAMVTVDVQDKLAEALYQFKESEKIFFEAQRTGSILIDSAAANYKIHSAYYFKVLEELNTKANSVKLPEVVVTPDDTDSLFKNTTKATDALKSEADAITKNIDVVGEYTRQIERLNLMREKGYISDNIYEEQLFRLQDGLSAAATGTKDLADKTKSLSEEMKDAAGSLISGAITGLVDLFFEANQSFSQFASNFLKEIAKMIAQIVILNALKTASKGTAFAGWFGANGMQLGGASGLPHGVYNTPTRFNLPDKYEGGQFRSGFKAFARGGVLGEAGPEAILPLSRGSNGKLGVAGSSTVVNVINNSGQEVKTSEQNTPDGGKIIDVIIGRKVQEMFANGSLDKMMRGVYGARRQAM